MKKKSGIIIAAALSLFTVFTVVYVSCKKSTQTFVRCEGVTCQNNGYCQMDTLLKKPKCICPVGWEGSDCGTPSVNKYFGTWNIHQVVIGSDSASARNDTSDYIVFLQPTATPTTFFINNFFDDSYYNFITCTLDSVNSKNFWIDSISTFHMVIDHYKIQPFAHGNFIDPADTSIFGTFIIRFKNKTTNWQMDTVVFTLTPHHI